MGDCRGGPGPRAQRALTGLSCRWRSQSTRGPAVSADSNSSVPSAPSGGYAQDVASVLPSPASRCVPTVPRSAAPPTVPAAPEPGSKESRTAAAIRSGAAAPTAPATNTAAGRVRRRDYARPAASVGRRRAAPFASRAARQGAHSTAGVTSSAAPPAAACAARSPRSTACPAAADVSRWRRSASRPNTRAPSARGVTPSGAPKASVWTAERLRVALRDVPAAHIVPTPARPSVTWWRSGRRRSP